MRLAKLRRLMKTPLLISNRSDIFYYTGFEGEGFLLVKKTGKPKLLLHPLLGSPHVKGVDVLPFQKGALSKYKGKVGYDEGDMRVATFRKLSKGLKLAPSAEIIKKPREIKDGHEIDQIKRAIAIDKGIFESLSLYGKKEASAARGIEMDIIKNKAEKAFDPIVASGRNAGNFIHHIPGSKIIKKGESVIVDFGARFNHYCSDVTRTLIEWGNPKHKKIYEDLIEIQGAVIDELAPGIKFKEIDSLHKKLMRKKGYKVFHSIGHGVGIDVHESASVLRKGMVITVEPGVYLKNYGGFRIEDMILIGKKAKILTKSIPQAL
jgi:Xaa-Pro aminopeptidase